jgi:hypothetical protein
MRKCKGRLAPRVESMESRELLSGVLPVLNMHTYHEVVAQVRNTVVGLARTHNVSHAAHRLTAIATEVPLGPQQLAPGWLRDLQAYNPHVHGAAVTLERQLVHQLNQDLVAGVAAGVLDVRGPGSAVFHRHPKPPGATAPSPASVVLANNTGLNITVTAFLGGTNQRITRQIGVNGAMLFDFGSNSQNYITINIQRTDGRTPPPLSTGNILNRPIGGYNGASYTISVFANLFSVSV